jgi:hypothetical protein
MSSAKIESFLAANDGRNKDVPWLIPPNKEEHKSTYGMCKDVQLE